jgi:pyruvate,water dikinase
VRAVLESYGLRRGDGGFKLHVMVEVPSNIEIADEYAACFDGLSIAGVGLSRLSLGTNGHSAPVFGLSDDMKVTVRRMLESIIARAHDARIPVSFCGGPPTDDGEFITFLVDAGIDSIAVSPYGVAEVIRHVAEAENGGDSRRRGP